MFKRKIAVQPYDKETQRPVIHSSICNGEQVAGFKDIRTGAFTEMMAIRSDQDMEEFLRKYDVRAEDIKKEW
ncbi:MAG: aspartate dehydrogenase [Roseburia sp.]|nr:aspartate dehydrogenase [Roseburia sp.]